MRICSNAELHPCSRQCCFSSNCCFKFLLLLLSLCLLLLELLLQLLELLLLLFSLLLVAGLEQVQLRSMALLLCIETLLQSSTLQHCSSVLLHKQCSHAQHVHGCTLGASMHRPWGTTGDSHIYFFWEWLWFRTTCNTQ
jgi:hypothetical protein